MKNTGIRISSLLLVLALLFSLAACGGTTEQADAVLDTSPSADVSADAQNEVSPNETPESIIITSDEENTAGKTTDADTLYVGAYGYTLASCDTRDSRNMLTLYMVYDTLFYHDYSSGSDEIKGLLAESWDLLEDEDGNYTFYVKLREGCHFASGKEIVAEDILGTWAKLWEMGMSAQHTYLNFEDSYADGDYEIYFALNSYEPSITHYMSLFTFSIINSEYWNTASDEDWWGSPDESGVFLLEEMVAGSHMKLKVRDDYWGWGVIQDRPSYDYMVVYYYNEASTMMVDYETGTLDVCLNISTSDLERVVSKGIESTVLRQVYGGGMVYLTMTQSNEYLSDKSVREAIRYAIDFEAAASAAIGVSGMVATGLAPVGVEFRTEFGVPDYDPDKAIALLVEAGYSQGDISLRLVCSNTETYLTYAEIFQAYLSDVGITLTIESYDPSTVLNMQRDGDCDLSIYSFSGGDHLTSTFNAMQSFGMNGALIVSSGEIDELYSVARYTVDKTVSEQACVELQDVIYENAYHIPLCQIGYAIIFKDYVDGVTPSNIGIHGLSDLRFFDLN